MYRPTTARKQRRKIDIDQNEFSKGYVSELADSRLPKNALADSTNINLVQDSLPTPRPSLVRYGASPLGPIIGVMEKGFVKIVSGSPERWEMTMQVISGKGHLCIRKDGGNWSDMGGDYDQSAIAMFAQSNNRIFVANGKDAMSYFDIYTNTIVTYTQITKPAAPTLVKTGLTGTNYTFYYRVSASNNVGETEGSVAASIQTDKLRNEWISGTDKVTLSWTAVSGATSYNIYVGVKAGNEQQIATGITATSFVDNGTANANPFKVAPEGNSTKAPKLTYIYNKNGQIIGCGDVDNPYYLWYSGTGLQAGDFSPFNGGGYVAIDYGGNTLPVSVRAFRDGKGTPVITVLSQGASGSGKLSHVTFNTQTVGDTTFSYPEVYEANGQAGTVSPRGTIEANNGLYYPTGKDFTNTTTKPNVVNILVSDSISQAVEEDVKRLNQSAMKGSVGLEYQGRLYWALPYQSTSNSEIWVLDLTRRGAWLLHWTIPAKFMWVYEDNSGNSHHCVYAWDKVLEFTDTVKHTDDGVAFRARVATGKTVFDESGVSMASIQYQRVKLLYPQGTIFINTSGLGEDGPTDSIADSKFDQSISEKGWNEWTFDSIDPVRMWDGDVGVVSFYSKPMEVIPIEVDELLNEIGTEIITETANTDYVLSAINTQGVAIDRLYYEGNN